MVFELHADDPAFVANATPVLSPPGRGTPSTSSGIQRSFRVRSTGAQQWVIDSGEGGESIVVPGPGEALAALEFAAIGQVIASRRVAGLHAALLGRDREGVLVVGRREVGKSTLACAMWQAGWSLLCDDYVMVDGARRAIPALRRVSLRAPSRALLGSRVWRHVLASPSCFSSSTGVLFHPHEVDGRMAPVEVPLTAVVFLGRRGHAAAPARLSAVPPAGALLALLPYCNLPRLSSVGSALEQLAPLADAVPAFDLGRGPLPEMVAALESLSSRRNGTLPPVRATSHAS